GLSGPLPSALHRGPEDANLNVFVSRVCAPAEWRDWLETIEFKGRLCDEDHDVTIDVAVVHTPAAREAAGGADAIAALIDLMVAETNQAYAASGVHQRLELVGRSEVPYDETGDSDLDLTRLRDPSDGHLDDVHALRDRVGADLVHLIVDADKADVGGIAYRAGAFGLTVHLGGGAVFAHELGHNMGLRHDRYQVHNNQDGARSHPAFGHVNPAGAATGAARSSRWRTVMAYNRQCSDAHALCSWLVRFSNPHQSFNGAPLGVPFTDGSASGLSGPADAVAVVETTGPAVARWRARPGDANQPPATVGFLPDRDLMRHDRLDVDLSAAFVDPDGDALHYAVSSSAPEVVTVLASGARLTLAAVGIGAATIRVTAADPGGLSVTQSFAVTVTPGANLPPAVVAMLPDRTLQVGSTLEMDLSAVFADPDQDPLAFAASSSASNVVAVRTSGARAILTAAALGTAAIRVSATDPAGQSAAQSFTVRVTRSAPFTDDPLQPGVTPVRAVHFTELRTRIDGLRRGSGLGSFP
ncbi:MAG: M12 family metallo-peptidase, partial [Acidobacteria bacterium]|nr:M12 family metallo-peptidase [Acidobacteriota bacterium]